MLRAGEGGQQGGTSWSVLRIVPSSGVPRCQATQPRLLPSSQGGSIARPPATAPACTSAPLPGAELPPVVPISAPLPARSQALPARCSHLDVASSSATLPVLASPFSTLHASTSSRRCPPAVTFCRGGPGSRQGGAQGRQATPEDVAMQAARRMLHSQRAAHCADAWPACLATSTPPPSRPSWPRLTFHRALKSAYAAGCSAATTRGEYMAATVQGVVTQVPAGAAKYCRAVLRAAAVPGKGPAHEADHQAGAGRSTPAGQGGGALWTKLAGPRARGAARPALRRCSTLPPALLTAAGLETQNSRVHPQGQPSAGPGCQHVRCTRSATWQRGRGAACCVLTAP